MNSNTNKYFYEKQKLSDLAHYGIKGMAWGVKNGPPYPLSDKINKAIKKYNHDEARNMSTQDLQKKINRYELENRYRKLAKQRSNPKMYATQEFLKKYGDKLFAATIFAVASLKGKDFLNAIFKK